MPTDRTEITDAAPLVLTGALGGIAWASGLRAYMIELVGDDSTFSWSGTFGALIAPAALSGGVLGWAEAQRRRGTEEAPGTDLRLFALSTLPLVTAPLLLPGALRQLVTKGIGSGAFVIVGTGLAGGYALSGRGTRTSRLATGIPAALLVGALGATGPALRRRRPELSAARGAWASALGMSSTAVLALACSIPFRP